MRVRKILIKSGRDNGMVVTATDLKINLGKYLSQVGSQEIAISKNGKMVARLVPYEEYLSDSLVGVLDSTALPEGFDGDYRRLIREMRCADSESFD